MSCRNIVQELAMYKRSRLQFCQAIGECASRPQNISYMVGEGIVELLQPLLTDTELPIRSNSVCCLSRMANHSSAVATRLVELKAHETMLSELLAERNAESMLYRRAVMQALKAISKHSAECAAHIVKCGGLTAFLVSLHDSDVLLREAACCGVGSIVRSSPEMANSALQQGAAALLVQCLKQNELNLKQVATLTLGDIARYSADHAQAIVDAGAVELLVGMVDLMDVKLKRQSLNALSSVATHNARLAQLVVDTDAFPKVLMHLCHESVFVQRQASRLVQEIAKHSLELSQIVINAGGIGPLVQCLQNNANHEEDIISPVAMAIGYIAGHSPHFASAIIESKCVPALAQLLDVKRAPVQLAAVVWALGHIGRHSSEHCRMLCESNVLTKVLEIYDSGTANADLRTKCKATLQSCFACCLDIGQMEQMIYSAPTDVLEMILMQLAKVLPNDPPARRLFQTVGGLKKIQDLLAVSTDKRINSAIGQINTCYSEEVINFYRGGEQNGGGGGGGGGRNSMSKPTTAMVVMNNGGNNDEKIKNQPNGGYKKPQEYFQSDNAPSTDRTRKSTGRLSK